MASLTKAMNPPTPQSQRVIRIRLAAVAAFLGAICMIALLFWWSGLSAAALLDRLSRSAGWLFAAIAALTIVQTLLSAAKWRMVLTAYGSDDVPGFRFCLFYSGISAFVSQFLPVHIATIVVRSIGAKRFGRMTLGRGAASSAFEQAFDVLVLAVFGAATLLTWLVQGNLLFWCAIIVVELMLGYLGLLAIGRLRRIRLDTSRLFGPLRRGLALFNEHFFVGLFTPRLAAKLLALSVLRYATIVARAPLILIGMGFVLPLAEIAQASTLVQLTQLAAITPGNLGLQEWSWAGVLALRGIPAVLATEFALSLRVLGIIATNIGLGLILGFLMLGQRK